MGETHVTGRLIRARDQTARRIRLSVPNGG